ncbi:MAG: hypothetical protein ACE5FB_00440 [Candidatus Binatia bacterium]
MLSRIDSLIASAKELYSRLSVPQRIGIIIAVGVIAFVFFGTMGVKQSPPKTELSGFKPYRPEWRMASRGNTVDPILAPKEGEIPEHPGPAVEVSILEEIKSLRGEIEELRSSVTNMWESAGASASEKVTLAISEVHEEVTQISLDLKTLKKKLKRDEQALKEQAPVDLIAIVSSGGLNYAILRTEAGHKRVTKGDRIGPWMVEEIRRKAVRLSTSSKKRILTIN